MSWIALELCIWQVLRTDRGSCFISAAWNISYGACCGKVSNWNFLNVRVHQSSSSSCSPSCSELLLVSRNGYIEMSIPSTVKLWRSGKRCAQSLTNEAHNLSRTGCTKSRQKYNPYLLTENLPFSFRNIYRSLRNNWMFIFFVLTHILEKVQSSSYKQ